MESRYEQKFLVPLEHVGLLKNMLRHCCVQDRWYPENTIYSMYFDTVELRSFHAVLDGDMRKEKIRLRWYESDLLQNNGALNVFLEVKRKEGFCGEKQRVKISLPREHLESLLKDTNGLSVFCHERIKGIGLREEEPLYPIVLIKHRRHRFREPFAGLRLSIDSEIHVVQVNTGILPLSRSCKTNKAVLEIKGALYCWPNSLKLLESLPLKRASFSKYAYCVDACRFIPEFSEKWFV
ncbi:MAG: VTC domain-containing protein [Candidatus Brocadia sp.]|nr:VTC domain-containing protein [Candidatus Brocadia sp.]